MFFLLFSTYINILNLFFLQIVKEKFAMVAPDVQIEDGKGTILISSEEGETEGINIAFIHSPYLGRDCLNQRVHVSLYICYICYLVSHLKGAIFGHGGVLPKWHCLDGFQIWELHVVSVSRTIFQSCIAQTVTAVLQSTSKELSCLYHGSCQLNDKKIILVIKSEQIISLDSLFLLQSRKCNAFDSL